MSRVERQCAAAALVLRNEDLAALRGQHPRGGGIDVAKEHALDASQQQSDTPSCGPLGGDVRRLEPDGAQFKVPHMGWNVLTEIAPHPLFAGLEAEPHMYFTHSFALYPDDAADVAAQAGHGGAFAAAVARDNIAGVQFHPEKSQAAGLTLLANFLEWRP